jgi:hypothetical protein
MMKKAICYIAFLLPMIVNADVQKILEITAESDPGLVAEMSLDVNDANLAKKLIYNPDTDKNELKEYPTEELLKDKVTLKSEKTVEIIGIKLSQIDATSYTVTLRYLYQFKLINKIHKEKQLNAFFSAPDNRYLVQDDETKKYISKLHFISNYNDKGKEVGIDRIETL